MGVVKGAFSRESSTQVKITLSGKRTTDYDLSISNLTLTIDATQVEDTVGGVLTDNDGVIFTATDDNETFALTNDGDGITEGSEDGEVLTLTITDGTFANPINTGNWSVTNLPEGVSVLSYDRISHTEVEITLLGNTTGDYDLNITNCTVTITEDEFDDYSGSDVATSGGVFTAIDEAVVVTIDDDGYLHEASIENELISVKIEQDEFIETLIQGSWTVDNLPQGITKGTVTRVSIDSATIVLLGTRTQDFDTDITNITVTINEDQLTQHNTSGNVSANTGVTILAENDTEYICISDDGDIEEGSEDGKFIIVTIQGGTFASSITAENWTLTNLPADVTKGVVTGVNEDTVTIQLSGNASVDYDIDITNVTLSVTDTEIDDHSGDAKTVSTGVTFYAVIEPAEITMTDDAEILEAKEDSEVITVNIINDVFVNELTSSNWTLTNLPIGVEKGLITRTGPTSATIVLSGNRTQDYDLSIEDLTLEIAGDEFVTQTFSSNVSTGVTFIATNDVESLVISDNGINEGAEDAQIITVELNGGTFTTDLNLNNWSISNLPTGVSVGNLSRVNDTIAEIILSENRSVDYDSDITDFTLSINQVEIDDYSDGDLIISTGVTFVAYQEALTISHTGLTEENLNNAEIDISLADDEFIDGTLDELNFTLNNAPEGMSINYVQYIDVNQATVFVLYDETDFDSDITDFSITISTDELYGTETLTSNVLTITATVEDMIITMYDDQIYESSEDGELLYIVIDEDEFIASLDASHFALSNLPTGVSKGTVNRVSNDTVTIALSGNRTVDYDADIEDVTVTILADQFVQTSTEVIVNTGVFIIATSDEETIEISADEIAEASEEGAVISVKLSGGTFVNPINENNWVLSDLPEGVSKGAVSRITSDSATIILVGNRSVDYDIDIIDMELSIGATEIDDHNITSIYTNSGVVFKAYNDIESLSMTDDGTLLEGAESGKSITVTLLGGTFIDPINTENWSIQNAPEGVSIGSINRVDSITAEIVLSGNRTLDYDENIENFSLSINEYEIDDYSGSDLTVNTGVVFEAYFEDAQLTHSGLTEDNINNEVITLTLYDDSFADITLEIVNFDLRYIPVGVSISDISYLNTTQAQITLAFDGTDFDSDYTDFSIEVNAAELNGLGSIITDSLTISANNDVESISINNELTINEGNENGAVISVTLSGGTFVNTLNTNNWEIENLPIGVSVLSIDPISQSKVDITLTGNRTVDYDSNVTNTSVTIYSDEINDHTGDALVDNEGVVFTASDEQLTIVPTIALTETNLSGNTIDLTLTNEVFSDTELLVSNFVFNNAPIGLSIESLSYTSTTEAQIELAFDGSDFDVDITNFSITISKDEIDGVASVISDEISITAVVESQTATISHTGLTEDNLNAADITLELVNETFVDVTLDKSNFSVNNAPNGCSISNVAYVSSNQATITLSYDGTDFDNSISDFTITTAGTELSLGSSITSNSLAIAATNDEEVITISDDGEIIEGSETDEIITVSLSGGTFVTPLNESNWSLYNLPEGVTVGSITQNNQYSVSITLSGNTIEDYDENITNVTLIIQADQVDDYSGDDILISEGVVFTAIVEIEDKEFNISHDGLTESNLDNTSIISHLVAEKLVDNTFVIDNFTLNNAPIGISVNSVSYVDSVNFIIILAYDGTDFDSDYNNFSITISSAELAGDDNLTSNELIITAEIESQQMLLSHSGLTEDNLNNATVGIELVNETFTDDELLVSNFIMDNAPDSLEIVSVDYIDITHAEFVLSFDGTDFDNEITNFGLIVQPSEITGSNSIRSNDMQITAINDEEIISLSDDGEIIERSENGEQITAVLDGGDYAANLLTENWQLINAPEGISILSVQRVDDNNALITLSGNATADYDTDTINAGVIVDASQIIDHETTALEFTGGIIFTALNESANILAILSEDNLDEGVIEIEILNDAFVDDILLVSNFEIFNVPNGTEISSVAYNSSTSASLIISFDGTDFDSDSTNVYISINAEELVSKGNIISDSITISAINEDKTITVSAVNMTEATLNNAEVYLKVIQETFADGVLAVSNFTLNNYPYGLNIDSVKYLYADSAVVYLSFNGTDFDSNISNFSITVGGAELSLGQSITSEVLTITATNDAEVLTMNDDGSIIEGNENGEVITVNLEGGTFIPIPLLANWTMSNLPQGVEIESIAFVDQTTVQLTLSGNRTADYDVDITNVALSIHSEEIDDYHSDAYVISEGITFNAINESLQITNDNLDEETLDGSIIILELSLEQFINDQLNPINFVLNNAPIGTTVLSVTYISATEATLELSFDGTDFDTDVLNFSISIAADEIIGIEAVTSNELVISAIIEDEESEELIISSSSGLTQAILNGASITMDLKNVYFIDEVIDNQNVMLNNAPVGLSVTNVEFTNDTSANVVFGFDGPKFNDDYEDFTISLLANEISYANNLQSNTLTIFALPNFANEIFDGKIVKIYSYQNNVFVIIDQEYTQAIQGFVRIYNLFGQLIYQNQLEDNHVNKYTIPAITNEYFIQLNFDNKNIKRKVFLNQE